MAPAGDESDESMSRGVTESERTRTHRRYTSRDAELDVATRALIPGV